jgi:hypothetical protein
MSNTITIELCAEDRARLDKIIEGLSNITAPNTTIMTQKVEELTEKPPVAQEIPETHTDDNAAPAEEVAPQPEPVEETPTQMKPLVTHDMIRQKVTKLMASGDPQKKDATRNIVKAYANNVTNLPEDKWPEIWEKLTALEG